MPQAELRTIAVLHEDEALLVVSKPAGMAVHGGAGETGATLIELLSEARPTSKLHLAHRLDRPTSGLLVVAKSAGDLRALQGAWEQAKKSYLAVALGRVERALSIELPIADKHGQQKSARTELRALAALAALEPAATLCAITLGTGRTHQIRLHLAELRHPVLGDDQHGDFAANKRWAKAQQALGAKKAKSLMLHSHRLSLVHPRSGERLRLTAPIPGAWRDLLANAGAPSALVDELGLGAPVDGAGEVP